MRDNKKIAGLYKVYAGYDGNTVIKNVNLDIFENDFIGIIGPNGGGKTTLIKVILGLILPFRGKVEYSMENLRTRSPIGYLPQMNDIDKKFPISVGDVVLSGYMNNSKYVRKYTSTEKSRVDQIMEDMGIYDLKKKSVGELSGGQLQRVFLGRAIVSSPRLLILDEPNTYVDNKFEGELYEKLRQLNKTMAILIVSHDIGMISTYIKTIACVNGEVHYHKSNIIDEEQLKSYNCPIQLITHGEVPHTVLKTHDH